MTTKTKTIIFLMLSLLMPAMTITAFVIGFNANAQKPILVPRKKAKLTDEDLMIERIDKATVY